MEKIDSFISGLMLGAIEILKLSYVAHLAILEYSYINIEQNIYLAVALVLSLVATLTWLLHTLAKYIFFSSDARRHFVIYMITLFLFPIIFVAIAFYDLKNSHKLNIKARAKKITQDRNCK